MGDTLLFVDQDKQAYAARGFEVQGQPMDNLSDAHLANWRATVQTAINNLEPTVHVDCIWSVDNDYSEFIDGHKNGANPEAHRLALHLMDRRIEGFKEEMNTNRLRYRKLYVFANLQLQKSQLNKGAEIRKHFKASIEDRILRTEWTAAENKLDQIITVLQRPFRSSGMTSHLLKHHEVLKLFRKTFLPRRSALKVETPNFNGNGKDSRPAILRIWNEIILSDIERRDGYLFFDGHYHLFITMANLPPETKTGFLKHIFNLSFPDYTFKVTLRTTVKSEQIKLLQDDYSSKMAKLRGQEKSHRGIDISVDTQAKEIATEIAVLNQTPQQIYDVQMMFHVWTPSLLELQRREDEVILQMGYCHGLQGITETIAYPPALRATIPGWTREKELDRYHPLKSANAADFIPASTDFVGTRVPQLLFPTPEAGLCAAHVFSPSRPWHGLIGGETGSGKTFMINSVVTQLVSQGLKSLSVISTKDEFEPLIKMYGGQKITFSGDDPCFLNPCMIVGEKPNADEQSTILKTFMTIFGDVADEQKRKIRESRIERAIGVCFAKNGPKTRLRHFVEVFRNGWDFDRGDELRDLAMILEPYAKGGTYGEFFDSDTRKPLDLSADFKFYNFFGIQNNVNLSSVMMMTLTNAEALRLSQKPKSERKALIMDECWAFVNSASGGGFIENALRVYRAYNCAVFLSSQQISDFLKSNIAHVIENNVHDFFLTRTVNNTAIKIMQGILEFTDQLAVRFRDMPDPGETGYAHFIYVFRGGSQLVAGEGINRVGKEEQMAYSTSPDVSELRDHYIRTKKDPWEAICQLAKLSKEEFRKERETLEREKNRKTNLQPEPELVST